MRAARHAKKLPAEVQAALKEIRGMVAGREVGPALREEAKVVIEEPAPAAPPLESEPVGPGVLSSLTSRVCKRRLI